MTGGLVRTAFLIAPIVLFALVGYVFPAQSDLLLDRGPASSPASANLAFYSPTPAPTATPTPEATPTSRPTATRHVEIASQGETAELYAMPLVTSSDVTSGMTYDVTKVVPAVAPTSPPLPPPPTPGPTGPVQTGADPAPAVNARSIVVVDGASGRILYELNAHESLPPASTTKIMTALVAIEHGNPRDVLTASYDASTLDPDSTLMGLFDGDRITLEDLLYGLMLPSGNEAALAIANHIGGSVDGFVAMMNGRAAELGMHDSHFANPHGLDASDHYSSAHDLTLAARFAYNHYPIFEGLSRATAWTVHPGDRTYDVRNLNRLLELYEGADGVKIGYTEGAGRTIVGSATRNGHRVFVSLMNTSDTAADAGTLLDWAFANFTWPAVAPVLAATTPLP